MSQHHDFAKHALPLQLNINLDHDEPDPYDKEEQGIPGDAPAAVPSICGMPLKYVSLVTLAVQNALLTLIMHYSRVSTPVDQTYSAGTAVLLTEVLKGTISLLVAFSRLDVCAPTPMSPPRMLLHRLKRLAKEVFRADCWKLSIPAILYVVQNNLQFVAVSNLEAATFQVSYQMKILTTAAFSVALLRKKLAPAKWASLFLLALGVGVVQIQNTGHSASGGSGAEGAVHEMNPFKGFMAVIAACFTSGLAGVYFEMVLKNTQADLWVRNVQLSLFSLLPALVPILLSSSPDSPSLSLSGLFAHFGPWAWATVAVQVLGGLLTALVIKYADNILKGFATSLSIVLAFLASAALFGFHMSPSFLAGASIVLAASWMYNQPDAPAPAPAQASALSSPTSGSRPTSPAWAWGWRRCRPAAVRVVSAGLHSVSTDSICTQRPRPWTAETKGRAHRTRACAQGIVHIKPEHDGAGDSASGADVARGTERSGTYRAAVCDVYYALGVRREPVPRREYISFGHLMSVLWGGISTPHGPAPASPPARVRASPEALRPTPRLVRRAARREHSAPPTPDAPARIR